MHHGGAATTQVVHKIEPSNHKLYPNKFFTVSNHTPDPACLLVYPTVHKFRTRPSHFMLRAGTDGFGVEVDTVQVLGIALRVASDGRAAPAAPATLSVACAAHRRLRANAPPRPPFSPHARPRAGPRP
jgi:hypothetical protein